MLYEYCCQGMARVMVHWAKSNISTKSKWQFNSFFHIIYTAYFMLYMAQKLQIFFYQYIEILTKWIKKLRYQLSVSAYNSLVTEIV